MTEYTVADVVRALDEAFPFATQDTWDNSGLLVGSPDMNIKGILLTLDQTKDAIRQAIDSDCNVVVSHHPLMFRGLKRLTRQTDEQEIIHTAIKNDIALIAVHTPADKSLQGTSGSIARLLDLENVNILAPEKDCLSKIVTYVPTAHTKQVFNAMTEAGAGHIGNYSHTSWQSSGTGSYMPLNGANPTCGTIGSLHHEIEDKLESIVPNRLVYQVVKKIIAVHPYEEPAIDIIPLSNTFSTQGYGVVGNLETAIPTNEFLRLVKEKLGVEVIRHTAFDKPIQRIAICTGSGSEFVDIAIANGADAYITADMKYHQMADATGKILVVDIGHFESEIISKNVFENVLRRKLINFARYVTHTESNPIKYFY